MGNLTPNATYTYEHTDDGVYAVDSCTSECTLVGYQYNNVDPRTSDGRPLVEHMREDQLWGNIRRAAKTNPALQTALDQCKIIYHLSTTNKDTIQHHPV